MRRNSSLVRSIQQNLQTAQTIAENMEVLARDRNISGHQARKMVAEIGDLIEVMFTPAGESTFRQHWDRESAHGRQAFQAGSYILQAYKTASEKTLHGSQTIEEGAEQLVSTIRYALNHLRIDRTFAL